MGRVARKLLIDKDIRALEPREVTYRVVVGNPSELYLFVYPSGNKSFLSARMINSQSREIPPSDL